MTGIAPLALNAAAGTDAQKSGRTSGVTSQELLFWVAAIFCADSVVRMLLLVQANGMNKSSWSVVELIVWGCVAQMLLRDKTRTVASTRQAGTILLLLGGSMLMSGNIQYVGLMAIGAITIRARGWSESERRVGMILLSIGMYRVVAKLVVMALADVILRLDTAAAGTLLAMLAPGSNWSGDVIRPPHDVGITVKMGCSSFANLSLVSLCYTGIALSDGANWNRRNLGAIVGICVLVIVLNTIRLMLMARSLEAYEFWHNGSGADVFGIGMSVITAALCSLGSRWANA